MKTVVSELACLVYIQNLRIAPNENKFSDEEFETLSSTKEFKTLKDSGKISVADAVEIVEAPETKDVTELSVAELKEYAKSLGLTGLSQANKSELLEAIAEVE